MKSIESLYDEYLSSGTCDAEAFLDLKGERSFFESLHGQWLKLVSPAQDQGSFLCLELRILRPSPFSELGFFLNSKGRIRRIEDPLEFLETCHVSEQVDKKNEANVWSDEMSAEVLSWLRDKIHTYERRREHEFNEDLGKLREYYQEFALEMEERKKAIFFHNYFFEKEARLKEEYSTMVEDLSDQAKNLHGRYNTSLELNTLFMGVLGS